MTRRRLGTIALFALLLTAALAGCLGADDGPLDPAGSDDATGSTDATTGSVNTTEEPAVVEETVATLDGSGTWGFGSGVTYSNFWAGSSEGVSHDVAIPDTFTGGTLTLSWEATESLGGMWVIAQDEDGEWVHVFEAQSSPLEVTLEADDARLDDVTELSVTPDQGMPATAHVEAEWTGELTLLVPTTGSTDDATAAGSSRSSSSENRWTYQQSGQGTVDESTTLNASDGRGQAALALDGQGRMTLTVEDADGSVVMELTCDGQGDCSREDEATGAPGTWSVTLEGRYQGDVRAGVRTS